MFFVCYAVCVCRFVRVFCLFLFVDCLCLKCVIGVCDCFLFDILFVFVGVCLFCVWNLYSSVFEVCV